LPIKFGWDLAQSGRKFDLVVPFYERPTFRLYKKMNQRVGCGIGESLALIYETLLSVLLWS